MILINTQQARTRFLSLPEIIQNIMFSVHTAETISRVAEENHIPQEKRDGMREAVGLALLGFIHTEEMASEISARSGFPLTLSSSISASLFERIFKVIKQDIDKIYAPAIEGHSTPVPPTAPTYSFIDITKQPIKTDSATSNARPPSPLASPITKNTQPLEMEKAQTGFMRITPPPSPLMPKKDSAPPPVILHEEIKPQVIKQAPSFIGSPGNQKLKDVKITTPPPRPAQVELGTSLPPRISAPSKKEGPPRVVNYNEILSPLKSKEPPTPPSVSIGISMPSPEKKTTLPASPSTYQKIFTPVQKPLAPLGKKETEGSQIMTNMRSPVETPRSTSSPIPPSTTTYANKPQPPLPKNIQVPPITPIIIPTPSTRPTPPPPPPPLPPKKQEMPTSAMPVQLSPSQQKTELDKKNESVFDRLRKENGQNNNPPPGSISFGPSPLS